MSSCLEHLPPDRQELFEGALEDLTGGLRDRLQHALLGDGRQIAVFECDDVEPGLPVLEHVGKLELQCPGQVLADQLAEVALPRHKAHERYGPVRVGGFHELHELGTLAAHEGHIRGAARQPQDKLVEEEDHGVVAQALRMLAHDAETIVERHEGFTAALGHGRIGGEEPGDQVADQAHALFPAWGFQHRRLEACRIPSATEVAPAAVATSCPIGVELFEKLWIAELLAEPHGVLEETVGEIKPRHRRLGVMVSYEVGVLAEDRGLHVQVADHVVGDQQEPLALRPCVMPRDHVRQLGDGAGPDVARKQEVQNGHEVALAGAEAAVQIRGFAATGLHRLLDEPEGVIETLDELRCDYIILERLLGVANPLGELQDEIAPVHALRDVNQIAHPRHGLSPLAVPLDGGHDVGLGEILAFEQQGLVA